jgi:hypothetical protein
MKNFRFAATVGAQILASLGAVALGPTEVNNEYKARFPGRSAFPKQQAADKLQQVYEPDKLT